MNRSQPPHLADWLLQRLTSGRRRESIIGDLHEQFARGRSVVWYWRHTITTILLGDAMKQRLLWLTVPTLVAAALTATLSSYLMPPRYQSETTILIVPQMVPDSYVRSTITAPIEHRMQVITQQILSRTQLSRVIQEFNLYPERSKTASMEELVALMRDSIRVQVISHDAFRVSFTASDARTAQQVADRLASLMIEDNLRDREVLAEGTNQFLAAQIEDLRRQIVEKEARLRQLRASTPGELSQGDLLPYEVLKDSYRALLQKQVDARVGTNLERRRIGEQFKVADPARLSEAPIGPSRTVVDVVGALAGLALGLVMVGISTRQKKQIEPPEPSQV